MRRPNTYVYRDMPVAITTDWTFPDVRNALDSHDRGMFLQSAQLVEAMTRDDRLLATLNTRTLGVLGLPRFVKPSAKADPRAARKVAKIVEDRWDDLFPDEAMSLVGRSGTMMGFGLSELVWDTGHDLWIPELRSWHSQFVYYRLDLRQYVVNTMDGQIPVDPGDGKWFLYTPLGLYRGWINGAVRSVAVPWLGRQFAFRDWLRFCEVHGIPIRAIKVPVAAEEMEKDAIVNQIAALGSDSTVALPQGQNGESWEFELLEAKDTSWQTFQAVTEDCDRRISIAILGQNLTTEVQGGSFAAAQVHSQVKQDYLAADALTMARALREQVLRYFAAYNFGNADLAPTIGWDVEPPEDDKLKADIAYQISQACVQFGQAGATEVDRRALFKRFSIPTLSPEDTPPAPVAAPPATPGAPTEVAPKDGETGDPNEPKSPEREGGLSAVALSASPKGAIDGQTYADKVVDAASARGARALSAGTKAILKDVRAAKNVADLKQRLLKTYAGMSPEDMTQVLAKASLLAHLVGRDSLLKDL